ncbi:hypothetical protein ACQ86G_17105 [Roseateles chitinivorans]|uniref:hypothetical protein n=1 Tax=Roseateles chitinivorans TaxID=2917965 RepID=UPI003D6769AE
MLALCLDLVACAPMPRLSARWYATIDEEQLPGAQPNDASTSYQRLVLGILNRDHTPVVISDVRLNPSWPGDPTSPDSSWPVQLAGDTALAPGELLLIEIEKKLLPPTIGPATSRTWTCRFPARATMNVVYRQQILGNQGVTLGGPFTLEIPDPMPTALAYGWTQCSAMKSGRGADAR